MKMIVGFRVLWSACLCVTALLVAAAPAGAVVNGAVTSVFSAPWNAALVLHGQSATSSQFCGGSVRDPMHVMTAAHCVFDGGVGDVARAPGEIDVVVGRTALDQETATYRFSVSKLSFAPGYDDVTGNRDVAVLTLAREIPPGLLAGPVGPIDPATSADAGDWDGLGGDAAQITGWGGYRQDAGGQWVASNELRGASVPVQTDAACAGDYGGGYDAGTMLCAGDATYDTCFGDSGGPLVVPVGSNYALAGITSFGEGCADPAHPGVYAEVADPGIHEFLTTTDPAAAPTMLVPPAVQGAATVGQTLTCSPGSWTPSTIVATQFVATSGATTRALTSPGPGRTYSLVAGDAGWQILCLAKAANGGGWARARSAPTAAVAAAPVVVPPQTPSQPPIVNPPPQPPAPHDVTAPRARFAKAACSRKRCVVDVKVTDSGFSAGVKGVIASVTTSVKRSCRRHGRRTTCTRMVKRPLRAVRRSRGRYRITLARPSRGVQRFAVLAVDKAGNRQLRPAVRRVRVR
jgi:hypothetical protein